MTILGLSLSSISRRGPTPLCSEPSRSNMASQPADFLHILNKRLVEKPKKKSRLKSYFDAHHEFQEPYREPSSSPETPTSSGYSSTTAHLCNQAQPLVAVRRNFRPAATKAADRLTRKSDLRSLIRKDRALADRRNSKGMLCKPHPPKCLLTSLGAGSRHLDSSLVRTPRNRNDSERSPLTLPRRHDTKSENKKLVDPVPTGYWRGGHYLRNTIARGKRAGGESVYTLGHRASGNSDKTG